MWVQAHPYAICPEFSSLLSIIDNLILIMTTLSKICRSSQSGSNVSNLSLAALDLHEHSIGKTKIGINGSKQK